MTESNLLKPFLKRKRVANLEKLSECVGGRSYRTIHRYLEELDYITSYSHARKYYSLKSCAEFDVDGLWRYGEIGFSRYGTLLSTVVKLVEASRDGYKHGELKLKLGVRVHNTLLTAIQTQRIGREIVGNKYLYVDKDQDKSKRQIEIRIESLGKVSALDTIEILVEIIRTCAAKSLIDPIAIMIGLLGKGVEVTPSQVKQVISKYEIKKTLD